MAAIMYCHTCLESLGDCATLFIGICAYYQDYAKCPEVNVSTSDVLRSNMLRKLHTHIQHLEAMGCIISTETGQGVISLKPLGFDIVPKDAVIRKEGFPIWCIDKTHAHERV